MYHIVDKGIEWKRDNTGTKNILSETDAKRTKIAKKEKTQEKEENLVHKRTK